MRDGSRIALFVSLICAWAAPASAAPAKLCAPTASGVPGRPGPPQWWTSGSGTVDPQPSDPRWEGATRITRGQGAHEEVSLRVLSHPSPGGSGTKYLYLEWAAHPTHAGADGDRGTVYLGLSAPPSGSGPHKAFVLAFDVGAATSSTPSELTGYELFTHTTDGSTTSDFESASSDLAWLNETASVYDDESGSPEGWFLRARIPIKDASATGFTDGLPVGTGDFRLWTQWSLPTTTSPDRVYTYPTGLGEATEITTPPVFRTPLVSDWKPGLFGTGDAACASGGIRLRRHDVGVQTATGLGHEITIGAANTFVAEPENTDSSTPVAADSLEATFRIADWGSTIDTGAWNEIGTDTDGHVELAAGGGAATLSIDWTPPPDYLDTHREHQCMLVELRGSGTDPGPGGAPGVTFLNESVYRNMDFVETGSVFSRLATISAEGLPAIEGATERDLYLYLETRNMPGEVDPKIWREAKQRIDYHLASLRGQQADESVYADAKEVPGDYEALRALMPTYVVHVYYDTGRTVRRNGKERRVLKSQPSFGYYVDHDDPLIGWSAALDGAEHVEGNWYRIRVGDDESYVVRTRVQGRESADEKPIWSDEKWAPEPEEEEEDQEQEQGPKEPPPPWWVTSWWLILLALGVVLLLAYIIHRKLKP